MAARHSTDLTQGPVLKGLLAFTLPLLLTNLLQQFYSAADVIVVGKFAGSTALAAVGSTSSITSLLLNFFNGLAVGANVICANLYGARRKEDLSKSMHTAILLALVCGVAVGAAGFVFAKPLLRMMNCPENVLDQASLYMRLYFTGVPASMVYNFGAGIVRAHGDTKRPMYILTATGLVNVVLNLVFVVFFHWDVAGVALATVAAQVLSAVAILVLLFAPRGGYKMRLRQVRFQRRELGMMVRVGIPCGLNGMVFSISNVILQSNVNAFGDITIAGAAAAGSITAFVYLIIASFSTACVSFAGQNYGARQYKRVDKLLVCSLVVSMLMVAVTAVAGTFCSVPLLSLYTDETAVAVAGTPMLIIMCWSYVVYAIPEITVGCLRGLGRSSGPTVVNALCICVPRILWVMFIFPLWPTTVMLYLCYPMSYIISAGAQVVYYRRCRRELDEALADNEPAAI
jgi:putative MATE family efflux protein